MGLALTSLAFAASAMAAGDGAAESSIFGGDVGNVLWTLITFFLTLFVLGKFAWGPILDMLQKREDFIKDSLDAAKKDRDEAQASLARYEERLASARAEATEIVEEGRRDAEAVRQRIEAKAQEEADKMIARAKREISIARETSVKELYAVSGQLATDLASKIVGRELKADDHQRLIDEALDQLNASGDAGAN